MTDQIEITGRSAESTTHFYMDCAGYWMAGDGAVALTREQIEDFLVDKLVERGEIADSDARKLPR